MRVLVRADLTGDADGLIEALVRRHLDVYVEPSRVVPPLSKVVAGVLTKPEPPAVDLAVVGSEVVSAVENGRLLTSVPGGYDAAVFRPLVRDWHSATVGIIVLGQSWLHQAMPHLLELRHANPGLVWSADVPRDPETRLRLYASAHLMVAMGPSRSYEAMEFLATGGAVVASVNTAHAAWLSEQWAWPVLPGGLRTALERVLLDRAEVRVRAERASAALPSMCSWDAMVTRLIERLPDNVRAKAIMAAREGS